MKNNLFLIINALFLSINIAKGMINPGQALESPREIVDSIERLKNFSQHQHGNMSVLSEEQVRKALWAYYVCDQYMSMDISRFRLFINDYQAWARDPVRYSKFRENNPDLNNVTSRQPYLQLLAQEEDKMYEDCRQCSDHKKILATHIDSYTGHENIMQIFKEPNQVYEAMELFKDALAKEGNQCLYCANHPKEYAEGLYKAEKLLLSILFAYYRYTSSQAPLPQMKYNKELLKKHIEDLHDFIKAVRKPRGF